ncbi:hypothetical protein PQX77_009942, partial [Marasmius sp. AFHP31]
MTVGGDDQHAFDAASPSNVGPNSSLPSSLLPHLYTGPSSGRTSRDSGTRTTLYSTDGNRDDVVVDENNKDGNENELQYPDTVSGTSADKSYRRSMAASAGFQDSQEQPSSPTTTTVLSAGLQHHHHQQPPRSHYTNDEPLTATSSSGSSAIEIRPPIRSDPVFYAQGLGNPYSHGQVAAYPVIPSPRCSSPGPGPSRRGSIGAGTVFSQPNSLPASSMLQTPVSPDSPYSQAFNDSSSSHSPDSSYKEYHLTHILSPPRRDWPRPSVNPVTPRDQDDVIRTYDEMDDSLYRGSARSFEEVERGLSTFNSASAGSQTIGESGTSNKSKKTLIACGFCRKRRIRCDGNRPSCFQCRSREDQECIYDVAPRRRGPGKANKGSRGAKPKNGYVGRSRQTDEDGDATGFRAEASELPHYRTYNERDTEALGSHHQQDFRAVTHLRGINDGSFTDRIDASLRQNTFENVTHPNYLPHPQHPFPALSHPSGTSSIRWPIVEDHYSSHGQIHIWPTPLPIQPYPATSYGHTEAESPAYGQRGPVEYPMFHQSDGVSVRNPPYFGRSSAPVRHHQTDGFDAPRLSVGSYHGHTKMDHGRSVSPPVGSRQILRDERLDVDA